MNFTVLTTASRSVLNQVEIRTEPAINVNIARVCNL